MRALRRHHKLMTPPHKPAPTPPSARPFCEATERENPANDALDRIEECMRQIIDAGGEFALRQRVARLLP